MTTFDYIKPKHESFEIVGNFAFLNPYSYLETRKDVNYFEGFDGIYVDGILMVIFWNLFFPKRKIKRISFDMTSLANETFTYAVNYSKTVYLIGAKENEIKQTVEVLRQSYEQLNIIAYRHGYIYSKEEEYNVLNDILMRAPDILIVGMGTPKQEKFLKKLKTAGWKGLGFTCGGFLHQTSKKLVYYPTWINKFHLRWLYRLLKEEHARKRFLKFFLRFPFFFTLDAVRYRYFNENFSK